ncbi:MAG: hypothetical protein AAF598_16565 [Bacteroidota bacterium]
MFSTLKDGLIYLWKDKWTLLSRVLLPLGLLSLLLSITLGLTIEGLTNFVGMRSKVAYHNATNDERLMDLFKRRPDLDLIEVENPDLLEELVDSDSINVGIAIEVDRENTAGVSLRLVYHARQENGTMDKIEPIIDKYQDALWLDKMEQQGYSIETFERIPVTAKDLYSPSGVITQYLGGFIAFFLILFGFLGCIYPALDLSSQLYSKSYSKFLVSMLAVMLIGWLISFLAYLSLKGALYLNGQVPQYVRNMFSALTSYSKMFKVWLVLLPCLLFFASFLTWIGLSNKTFKRAQNFIQPVKIAALAALVLVMLPSIHLDGWSFWVPFLNSGLVIREVVAGADLNLWSYLSIGMLALYTLLCDFMCRRYL